MIHLFENEIKNRLSLAEKVDDLSAENKDILIQIIQRELNGNLTGSYYDIPNEVYHHNLCSGYSSTTIKRILKSSFNHWYVSKNDSTSALKFGSAFHAFCGDPDDFQAKFSIGQFDSKREKEFKTFVSDQKSVGKTVISRSEFDLLKLMSVKLFNHPDATPLIKGAKNEVTFFSQDQKTGLWKKCKVDGINGGSVYDLKTCVSAAPSSFVRDARELLYRISASYYLEVISESMNSLFEKFYLIACEKDAPNEVAVYRVDESSLERAQQEIRDTLDIIYKIKIDPENAWKGYQLGKQRIVI